MVYAIIQAGGKQFKVSVGDELLLEKIKGEEGEKVEVGRVLLINQDGELISDPKALSKAKVEVTILGQTRDDKISVFKYRPKKGYQKEKGHRQSHTKVRVEDIVLPKKSTAARPETAPKEEAASEKKAPAAKKQSKS